MNNITETHYRATPANLEWLIETKRKNNVRRGITYALVPKEVEIKRSKNSFEFVFKYSVPEQKNKIRNLHRVKGYLTLGVFTRKVLSFELTSQSISEVLVMLEKVKEEVLDLYKDTRMRSMKQHYQIIGAFIDGLIDYLLVGDGQMIQPAPTESLSAE